MSGSTADHRFESTAHAVAMMAERAIDRAWVERTVLAPDQAEPDPSHPDTMRVFRAVPERDGRVLRVGYRRTDTHFRIITTFLDRGRRT